MNTTDVYLGRAAYDALLDGLCALKPDPLTGQFERHQFVELLGEAANIWPVTVLDDPERTYEQGRANLRAVS